MTEDEEHIIYCKMMMRTFKEVKAFARKHGVSLGYDASNKHNSVKRIINQMVHDGYDFDILSSMVDTPSSFREVD